MRYSTFPPAARLRPRAPDVPATVGEALDYLLRSALPTIKVQTLADDIAGRPPRYVGRIPSVGKEGRND